MISCNSVFYPLKGGYRVYQKVLDSGRGGGHQGELKGVDIEGASRVSFSLCVDLLKTVSSQLGHKHALNWVFVRN